MKITSLDALQIFDSRGNPTVEVIATLEDGTTGHGLVPSGASTGHHEALELRDGDKSRFGGKSVFKALSHVKGEIAREVIGRDVFDQSGLDAALIALDGTQGKSRLGANAILGTSMAVAQAAANAKRLPLFESLGGGEGTLLPLPEIQIFGGGKHAQGRIDIQDFMIMALTAKSYDETLEVTANIFHAAADIMRQRGLLAGVADEGGYWPMFDRNEDVFDALIAAIELAGYTPGREVGISLDIAATDLYRDGYYTLGLEQRRFTTEEFAQLMIDWIERYPIVSIEDPMAEDDWEGWKLVRQAIGHRCQLIGDDHFTTNLTRIERGIAANTANAVLIKLNQIGTVTETLAAIRRTQAAGWLPVVSARSGETEDAFIAHLAVATNAGQLKVGSFSRSERMAKWNEVLRIQRHLGNRARFIGADILTSWNLPAMNSPDREIECTIPILSVGDLERSIQFYTETLGFKLDWRSGPVCSVSRDARPIMLKQSLANNTPCWVWIVLEGDSLFHLYRERGVKILQEPMNWSWAYEMKFEDPDGNVLWLGTEPRDDQPKQDMP